VNVFNLSGSTTVPFLHPGCLVDVEMRKVDTNETSYFTRIMVTETTHEIDTIGHYSGSFQGIASDTGFLPKPEFTVPIAQPQIATVISNTDPEGQGRVQVRFDWQTNDTTHFIRMMSPDAGGTDQITQNRGYVAIPEVGDQVMVNFVHNHPDRPFVMGGMFHGGTALGGGINNHMRSIQTKSGIKVLMNDDEGSVNIIDPSGNTYFMDGKGNITVTSPKNMTFNVGDNLHINVGKSMTSVIGENQNTSVTNNITISAGNDIFETATGNRMEMSNNRTEMVDNDYTRQSLISDIFAKKMTATSSEEDILIQSAKTVHMNSGEKGTNH
ncbi:phage baseplate assembly protein V, partial [Chryseobacterium sp. 2R14A]|uniref:phage baseplate assembly protein V n=1 Tax=Chryseobacterium sp. 2R14A TaxID=3380353 RepID=UPI003CF76D0B